MQCGVYLARVENKYCSSVVNSMVGSSFGAENACGSLLYSSSRSADVASFLTTGIAGSFHSSAPDLSKS